MTQLAEHLSNFSRLEKRDTSDAPAWLDDLRKAAIARFELVGFPTTKLEDWRFTNVAPIARTPFKLAEPINDGQIVERAAEFSFGKDAACELVFVNGHYTPQLSKLGKLPRSATVRSLSQAL